MNKKELYESIMTNVAKEVKKALNESAEKYLAIDNYEFSLKTAATNYKALVFAKAVCEPCIIKAIKTKYRDAVVKSADLASDLSGADMVVALPNKPAVSVNAKIFNYKTRSVELGKLTADVVAFIYKNTLYIIQASAAKQFAQDGILYKRDADAIIDVKLGNSKMFEIDSDIANYYEKQFKNYLHCNASETFADIATTVAALQEDYFNYNNKYFQFIGK